MRIKLVGRKGIGATRCCYRIGGKLLKVFVVGLFIWFLTTVDVSAAAQQAGEIAAVGCGQRCLKSSTAELAQMKQVGVFQSGVLAKSSFCYQYKSELWVAAAVILVLGLIIMILSVSLLRLAQVKEELKRSGQFLDHMINALDDPVFVKDEHHRWLILNDAACKMMGRARQELIGKSDYDLFSTEQADVFWERDNHVLQTGQTDINEEEITWHGKLHTISTKKSLLMEPTAGKKLIAGTIRDITQRKQMEDALRESEARYKALFEGAAEGILVAEVETQKFRYANPAICKMLGYSEAELGRMGVSDIHPKEDVEHVMAEFAAQAGGKKNLSPAVRCLRKDGTIIYADINTASVHINGQIYNVGFFTDVTEHKKAEKELMFKSALLEAQSETSIDGILVVDGEGKSVLFNRHFGRMWNIPQEILDTRDDEKMLRYVLSQLKDPEKFLSKVRYLYAHRDEKSRDEIEFKDGRIFDRYSSALVGSTGKHYGRIWYFRDISELKRAEERLLEERNLLRTLIDNIPDLIYVKDTQSRFTVCNSSVERFMGAAAEELIGKTDFDFYPEGKATEFYSDEQETIRSGQAIINKEEPNTDKTGALRWILTSKLPLRSGQGKVVGIVGIGHDITERKHAEDSLQKARDELEIRVKQRTAELAKANEELRTEVSQRKTVEGQLLSYQSQLRSLASELSLAEERLRRHIAMDVHDHIGQNLAISKIKLESLAKSARSQKFAAALGEIRDLIGETIESTRSLTFELSPPVLYELGFEAAVKWLVRETRQRYGFSTEFEDDGRAKPLDDDVRVLLFQAVRELLVNVAKHSKARRANVSTRRFGDEVRVIVEDDGVGFDASSTTGRNSRTGGFGLFSIRERLQHIGGRFKIESRAGQGTRVTLGAPVSSEQDS